MRRLRLMVGTVGLVTLVAGPGAPMRAGAQSVPGESPCVAWADGSLSASWVARGEDIAVRTTLRWSCPERTRPYHLGVVVDAPALIRGEGASTMRRQLGDLVDRMGLGVNDRTSMGLVAFGAAAEWLVPLGHDERALHEALTELAGPAPAVPPGRGGLAAGLREGLKMLALADHPVSEGETEGPLRQGLILVARPESADDCMGVPEALDAARMAGVDVTAVCLTPTCASTCLAGAFERVYALPEWDIVALAQENLAWSSRLGVAVVDLVDALEPTLVLDPSSVDSANATYHPGYHRVRWRWDVRRNRDQEVTLVYKVRPTRAGAWQVRLAGNGFLVDTRGQPAQVELPRLEVTVSEERILRLYFPACGQRLVPLARDKPLGAP